MKEYLNKIIAVSLLIAIIPMASGFCFMVLFASPLIHINTASAATIEQSAVGNVDACSRSQDQQTKNDLAPVAPASSHNNSVLPCCVDGSHSGILAISQQLLDSGKYFAAISAIPDRLLAVVVETEEYHTPIVAPPNLLAVRTTVLRL